jgi:tetratricopeptide (TPR) repeat protein
MREIGVGIRIDLDEGLSFSGIEQVNAAINLGGKVTAIEPGGAIMRKLIEDDENVRLTLSGCEMKVIVDDSHIESSPAMLEHNRLYQEGCNLISPYLQLVNKPPEPATSDKARGELDRGVALLRRVVSLNPANWPAYWTIGKAFQALGNAEAACDAFGKAYALHKGNADVAREYMFECLNLGETDKGIAAARHAVALKSDDAGLLANLALALLIGGELDEAAQASDKSLAIAPDDEISQNVKQAIEDVRSGRRGQPRSLADLEAS